MSPPPALVDRTDPNRPDRESPQAESESELNDRPAATSQIVAVEEGSWKSFASFTVQFQTRQVGEQIEQRTTSQHQETDVMETCDSFELEKLQAWMLAQIQPVLKGSLEPTNPPTDNLVDGMPPAIAIEIVRVQIVQPGTSESPMVVNQPSQIFPNSVKSGEPFNLEVAFNVRQPDPSQLWFGQQQIPCSVQCCARHRSSRMITPLETATANLLVQGEASYTAILAEVILKQPGSYRLQVLVTLESALATPDYFEIPVLQVV
jgi:hypothetical protein